MKFKNFNNNNNNNKIKQLLLSNYKIRKCKFNNKKLKFQFNN